MFRAERPSLPALSSRPNNEGNAPRVPTAARRLFQPTATIFHAGGSSLPTLSNGAGDDEQDSDDTAQREYRRPPTPTVQTPPPNTENARPSMSPLFAPRNVLSLWLSSEGGYERLVRTYGRVEADAYIAAEASQVTARVMAGINAESRTTEPEATADSDNASDSYPPVFNRMPSPVAVSWPTDSESDNDSDTVRAQSEERVIETPSPTPTYQLGF